MGFYIYASIVAIAGYSLLNSATTMIATSSIGM